MTNYEIEYQKNRNICGKPSTEIIGFFKHYTKECAAVLDLGCGQGRDTLFIAGKGHTVLGVDTSQTGISQMLEDADSENLSVEGIVADVLDFEPNAEYDVVVIDRVLHMLANDEERKFVLVKSVNAVCSNGFMLIVDTVKNHALICKFFTSVVEGWEITKNENGFVFAHKTGGGRHECKNLGRQADC
jgi:2-polyprenyl-3-methyl-5-hydroxy-6-metoxy-1,4-benzoquinol methylase